MCSRILSSLEDFYLLSGSANGPRVSRVPGARMPRFLLYILGWRFLNISSGLMGGGTALRDRRRGRGVNEWRKAREIVLQAGNQIYPTWGISSFLKVTVVGWSRAHNVTVDYLTLTVGNESNDTLLLPYLFYINVIKCCHLHLKLLFFTLFKSAQIWNRWPANQSAVENPAHPAG